MSMTNEQIAHIAKLSRLQLEESEIDDYRDKIGSILDYVTKLQELELDGVEELQHAAEVVNVFREDIVQGCEPDVRVRALENFSNKEADLLKVQAVFTDSN